MGEEAKPIPAGKKRKTATGCDHRLVAELLKVCSDMLPFIRRDHAGTPEGDRLVLAAERAVAKAEREAQRTRRAGAQHKTGFFGRVGNHYDFEISVTRIYKRVRVFRVEGRDRLGRQVVVRVQKGTEDFDLGAGASIFFRGKVLAHRQIFGEPVTFIEATSGVIKA